MICSKCLDQLDWNIFLGAYTHRQGGGMLMQRCDCGWRGNFERPIVVCPKCGGALRDDHIATPRREYL